MASKDAKQPAKVAKKIGHFALKAVDLTIDSAAGTVTGVLKIIGTLLLVFLIAGLLFACIFAYYIKSCLTPTLDITLEEFKLEQSSTLYYPDADGQWVEMITLAGGENRVWVDYENIPENMVNALIAIEDKRFYEHKGVDWYRSAGAFVKMFATMQNNFGGSTITQQLIKNLTGNDDVTVQRKLSEIFSALELEKKYDKREILEWYMNAVYFGEGAWGVQTAAQTYFGKDVSELDLAECAAIVGITNLPTYYDPFYNEEANKTRQETILREMYDQGFIDYQTYKDACAEELVFAHSEEEYYTMDIYTYYEEVVVEDVIKDLMEAKGVSYEAARKLLFTGGYRILTCFDPAIQAQVDTIYNDVSRFTVSRRSGNRLQSAIVIMDPYTGKILALSGGVGEKDRNFGYNRATQALRPAGSSIKPLASYGPATDLGLITPNTLVSDSPEISLVGTSWYPQNDGGDYFGTVTIYEALQYSLNTVAAQIVDKLPEGPQTSYDYLTQRLGFTSPTSVDIDYAAMALGQFNQGVTVREMAAAYCAFVNDGVFTKSRTYTMILDSKGNVVLDNQPVTNQAFKENTAHVITYMLQNAVARGTGTEAYMGSMPVAGKTGTTSDYKDKWFVGCTPYYVAAVWTGYDTPEYVSASGNPAARLFKSVMRPIHEGLEYKSFTYPQLGGDTGIFYIVPEPEEDDIIFDSDGGLG